MSRQRSKHATADASPRARERLRRSTAAALAALLLLSSGPAGAQTATSEEVDGVLELFTSQGCSACPPADETLTRFAAKGRTLALSYHVDYWDYIGWKDPLGSARNAERQRAYAKAMRSRSVFTPQMIVNGSRDAVAADDADIDTALKDRPLRDGGAAIRLTREGSTLRIDAEAAPPLSEGEQAVLILVTFRGETHTEVERGENDGRRLVNTNSVRDWQVVGKMTGKPVEVDMPVATLADAEGAPSGCAAILQVMDEDGEPGRILAAAMLPL